MIGLLQLQFEPARKGHSLIECSRQEFRKLEVIAMTDSKRIGFAAMTAERQREIASMGGRAVSAERRSFSRNPGLAAAAGAKGGQNVSATKRSFSKDRALASEAGRKGGKAVRAEQRSFSQDRTLAVEAGRKGGVASHAKVA